MMKYKQNGSFYKLIIAALLLSVPFIFSCGNEISYVNQVKTLDSIQVQLSKIELQLRQIDTAKLAAVSAQIGDELSFIQTNYKDTMKKDMAMVLTEYQLIRKSYNLILLKFPEAQKELTITKEQLKSLGHDLKTNSIDKANVEGALNTEMGAANESIQTVILMNNIIKLRMPRFEELKPNVMDLVNELKEKAQK